MNQPAFVQTGECCCEAHGKAQELLYFHRRCEQSIESLAARIFEHERGVPAMLGKGQGTNCPG
jgi:hypothetical protein